MMNFMRKFARAFRSDQNGAVAFLTICAAVPLTLLMFYMVNSAKAVNDRTRNQDAVDMAVLAHAAEGARAMNTIAMNQVSLTQAWTVTSTAGTFFDLAMGQIAVLALQTAAVAKNAANYCKGPPPWIAICLARLAVPTGFIVAHGIELGLMLDKYNPRASYRTGRKSMLALNKMNNAIVDRYAKAAGATASLVAKSANSEDLYFDNHCRSNCGNANITVKAHRIGMSLPVDKNPYPKAPLNFCAALHFGSIGASISLPFPGISSIGASAINGSYRMRTFPAFEGPMQSGKGPSNMTKYVNEETGFGRLLEKNYDFSRNKAMLWVAQSTWGELKGGWPTKQKEKDNYYTQWMTFKTAAACAAPQSLSSVLQALAISPVPSYDLYHPKGVDIVSPFPSIDDFTDDYKILGFTYRRPNKRWSPKVFKDPNQGYYTYAQGLLFNPDEIGLYSQNWQAKLIPAKRMETQLNAVTQRMGSYAPASFSDLKNDLERVTSKPSWSTVVAK